MVATFVERSRVRNVNEVLLKCCSAKWYGYINFVTEQSKPDYWL